VTGAPPLAPHRRIEGRSLEESAKGTLAMEGAPKTCGYNQPFRGGPTLGFTGRSSWQRQYLRCTVYDTLLEIAP